MLLNKNYRLLLSLGFGYHFSQAQSDHIKRGLSSTAFKYLIL